MTTIGDIIRTELSSFAKRHSKKTLRVLEVGVLRVNSLEHLEGDGHSTMAFTRLLREFPGSSYMGVDLKVSEARNAVGSEDMTGIHVSFLEGDSLEMLQDLIDSDEVFDVIYLDADNSAESTMEEYKLARKLIASPGLIMGDDMNLDLKDIHKGKVLIPYLREQGEKFSILHRNTPWDVRDILIQEITS